MPCCRNTTPCTAAEPYASRLRRMKVRFEMFFTSSPVHGLSVAFGGIYPSLRDSLQPQGTPRLETRTIFRSQELKRASQPTRGVSLRPSRVASSPTPCSSTRTELCSRDKLMSDSAMSMTSSLAEQLGGESELAPSRSASRPSRGDMLRFEHAKRSQACKFRRSEQYARVYIIPRKVLPKRSTSRRA